MSPQSRTSRAEQALWASRLYYHQDLTMEAIAQELKVSRSSVSRLLTFARESGLVEITIHSPEAAQNELEAWFANTFGVTAHVVRAPSRATKLERLDRTAHTAAAVLTQAVQSQLTIGVAWGSTLSAVASHLQAKPTHDSHIVQMNGAVNLRTTGVAYAGELLGRFATAFQMAVHEFPVPALFDDPATKQAMWRERSVHAVLEQQARAGVFMFGLGSPRAELPSHVYSGGYLDRADRAKVKNYGIVGDCATVFYRADGSDDGIDLNERSSGPSLDAIREIPHRLCVVSSSSKRDSLRGALAAGLITELVVDEVLARAVYAWHTGRGR
ncbi:DNA-binding transcriptional regulator LsrR (DeoR family) [Leucobacter exalbidus]|uniref:DNA-binding transcriptional regulator LsrR (DeoR family) n=1 Tax=Leucobacter exalbidus TaxID=662960 RepID=A0A940PQJ8_9MICO|nr:sugar-binding domain-containing protein [Leucobacter exalbidus]MBP1324913.1 DNA-binding transcriptional regulator LsrR (DeoR family) [Leucobacter exalbidus]